MRGHAGGVAELDDAEGEEGEAGEERCGQDGWAPGETAGEVD